MANGIVKLVAKYNELLRVAKGLRDVLVAMQWDDYGMCLLCGHHMLKGHGPDCQVKRRLDEFKAVLEK